MTITSFMKLSCRLILLCAPLALGLLACHKRSDVSTSTSELEKAFPTAAATSTSPPPSLSPAAAPPANADALVQQALAAARANDYAGGVIALQAAQEKPGVTPAQVTAVQHAKRAMMADLQRRAESGDAQALAQLKAIERTRSQ